MGFKPVVLHEEYNLSDYPVHLSSFDNNFPECNIIQELIFQVRQSAKFLNFAMDVDLGYKYFEEFRGRGTLVYDAK